MTTQHDPKGLVREAFKIEGITPSECRSILIDWALSLPAGTDQAAAASALLAMPRPDDHPMTALLRDAAQASSARLGRRGGRAGRLSGTGQDA